MRRHGVYPEYRLNLLRMSRGRCSYCRCFIHKRLDWTRGNGKNSDYQVDHVVSVALGGLDDMPNLLAVCRKCNYEKGSKSLLEWVDYLEKDAREYAGRMWRIAAWHETNMLKRKKKGDTFVLTDEYLKLKLKKWLKEQQLK